MATNPGTWPWATLAHPPVGNTDDFWLWAHGDWVRTSEVSLVSKKCHNPYSPSSPKDCKHTGTPPMLVIVLGLATGH